AVGRRSETQALKDLALGEAEFLDVVADIARQAAAMGEQVADRDGRCRKLVMKGEAGVDVADAAVPRDLAVAHQGRDDGRGQRLGERGQLEDGVDVDRLGLADLTRAEALEEGDVVAMDDGDRQAGYELLIDGLPRKFFEFGQGRRYLLPGRGLRECRQWDEQRCGAGEERPPDGMLSLQGYQARGPLASCWPRSCVDAEHEEKWPASRARLLRRIVRPPRTG